MTTEFTRLKINSEPATEPVTLAEAKVQCRVDEAFTDDDTYITTLITVARRAAERHCDRAFITQDWDLSLDMFYDCILLRKSPVASIENFAYIDTAGDSQTLTEDTDFQVDYQSEPARIIPEVNTTWPSVESGRLNAVTITFRTGYGAASAVPVDIKQAILMLIAHYYDNREAVSDIKMEAIPMAFQNLLAPYTVRYT